MELIAAFVRNYKGSLNGANWFNRKCTLGESNISVNPETHFYALKSI